MSAVAPRTTGESSTRRPAPALSVSALRAAHWSWTLSAFGFALVLALALGLMLVDDRQLFGVSVWLKPAKFALSFIVYFGTLSWCVALLEAGAEPGSRRFEQTPQGRWMAAAAISMAASEMAYIFFMAGLAQRSHFNGSTPWTALAYALMGVGAVILVTVCLWLAVVIAWRCADRWRDPLVLSVVLGLALTFLLGGGFGGYLSSSGGHWVGGEATDANGLPLVGWSRTGGDLRIAHFFGMHAMQVLPVIGWLVRSVRYGVPILLLVTLAYVALATFSFTQAIAGRPFL